MPVNRGLGTKWLRELTLAEFTEQDTARLLALGLGQYPVVSTVNNHGSILAAFRHESRTTCQPMV